MSLHEIVKAIHCKLTRIFSNIEAENWVRIKYRNWEFKKVHKIPLAEYSTTAPIIDCHRRVVCICDGKTQMGGLADRLRGIVSMYKISKELDLDFKIIFNYPFNLQQYLAPNKTNWLLNKNELNYNTRITDICYIPTMRGSQYEAKQQERWFIKEFNKSYKEFHVRTNAFFSYNGNFSTLFNELFKPTLKLQASIDKHKSILGKHYISISTRFLNLLDDFNEPVRIDKKLTEEEKKELITRNICQVKHLHYKYPDKRILVNSDSITFLQKMTDFEYVYTIPGNITHIDGNNNSNEYQAYEKTFLDLFMIANADKIYLLRTGDMYNSGYPFIASKINNKPFEIIEF